MLKFIAGFVTGLAALLAGAYFGFYLNRKESKIPKLQECYEWLYKLFTSVYDENCHQIAVSFQEFLISNRLYLPQDLWVRLWVFKNKAPNQKGLKSEQREVFFTEFDRLVAELARESEVSLATVWHDIQTFFIFKKIEWWLKTLAQTKSYPPLQ